jgi:hypothetical protein
MTDIVKRGAIRQEPELRRFTLGRTSLRKDKSNRSTSTRGQIATPQTEGRDFEYSDDSESALRLPGRRSSHSVRTVCLSIILLAGCVDTPTIPIPAPVRVQMQSQAATVLVTPSMVAPWSYVSSALKPNFTMSGDAAVAQVLPTTEIIQSQVLSAFGASLGVGLPSSGTQTSTAQTSTSSQGSNTAGGVTTTTASNNDSTTNSLNSTTSPGVAPTPPAGTPAGAQVPTLIEPSGNLGLDPVTKFKAAAYLQQEVQLLNQEIDNAAVRECYVPYVVKLKLAVMTYRPHLAYSVHTRLSFLPKPGSLPPLGLQAQDLQAAEIFTDPRCLFTISLPTPIVVPFLVADDMEMALKSRTSEAAQQIAFALNLMVHGVGANAGLNDVKAALNAIQSRDLTSALTVARDNDNTLYIHIEPNNQASGDPSLVGQTYDVAVLLLVPRGYFTAKDGRLSPAQIATLTFTQFRDASTGEVLPRRTEGAYITELDGVVLPYVTDRTGWWEKLSNDQKIKATDPLIGAIEAADFAQFQQYLEGGSKCIGSSDTVNLCPPMQRGPALWAGLSSVISNNAYKYASFEAPVPAKITVPVQTLIVSDDKFHPIQVSVGGVGGASTATLAAYLRVATFVDEKPPTLPHVISVPAQSVSLDPAAHVLNLTFPSLGKLGMTFPSKGRDPSIPIAQCLDGTDDGERGVPGPSVATDKKTATSSDGSTTVVVGDCRNEILIQRVNCDPKRDLCPELEKQDTPNQNPMAGSPALHLPIRLVSDSKPAPKSIVSLGSEGSAISINHVDSTGVLPITVSAASLPSGETLALNVSGAPLLSATTTAGSPLSLGKNGYVLPQSGVYVLKFIDLTPGEALTVSVQAIKADGKTPDGDPATATYTAIPQLGLRP